MISLIAFICINLFTYCDSYRLPQRKSSVRYLETNSWQINLGSIEIMLDPVLYAPLDFGIPALYSGKKRQIDGMKELQRFCRTADYCLLSQGLDDHAHTPTLTALSKLKPTMVYIAPPSALSVLTKCGVNQGFINIIKPGESIQLKKGTDVLDITATTGALVGPPWQDPENGYILKLKSGPSIYYEPHCMYNEGELARYQADYVITPVVAQELPFFTLVAGRDKSIRLAELLKAKAIIPMV